MRKIWLSLLFTFGLLVIPTVTFGQTEEVDEPVIVNASMPLTETVGQGNVENVEDCPYTISRMTTFVTDDVYPQYMGLSTVEFYLPSSESNCFYSYEVEQENIAAVVITTHSSIQCSYITYEPIGFPHMKCMGYLPYTDGDAFKTTLKMQFVTNQYVYRPIEFAADWTNTGEEFSWAMFGWGTLIPAIFR